MNVDLGIWSKLTKMVAWLLLLAGLLLVCVWYLPLIQQNERMQRENLRLERELEKEKEKAKELQADIDALRNDPQTVTRLVRETLRYAKSNETVILFETNSVSTPPK